MAKVRKLTIDHGLWAIDQNSRKDKRKNCPVFEKINDFCGNTQNDKQNM